MMNRRDPRRPILVAAICLLGASGVSALAGLHALSPWFLLAGALLLLLWFVVRKVAATPVSKEESMLFGQSTSIQMPPGDSQLKDK